MSAFEGKADIVLPQRPCQIQISFMANNSK